jgi:hypothetical protein
MSNLPESIWTQEEYNRCILQLKSMGLSPESIAYILESVVVVSDKPMLSISEE